MKTLETTQDVLWDIISAIRHIPKIHDTQVVSGRQTSAGVSIHSNLFASAPTHVPIVGSDPLDAVRTQAVIYDNPEVGTTKLHWWHRPDITPPHDHPWAGTFEETGPELISFVSTILVGGYAEERWTPQPDGTHVMSTHCYKAGDTNVMPYGVFHKVIAIEPGTVTLMVTGPRTADGKWYFYDPVTNTKRDPDRDPNYMTAFRTLNPHLRPKA